MIRPLRQCHRRMVVVLGLLLPIAFAIGIATRNPVPQMDTFPGDLATTPKKFAATEWERTDLFIKSPISVRLLRENPTTGRFAVGFSAAKDFLKPDLIVYWVAANPSIRDTLPDNAKLLGTFSSFAAMALPAESATETGQLVLYSLADAEIVEISKPTRFNDSTK